MSEFNLKKKNARQKYFYKKNNILSKIGNDLISSKIQFISKELNDVLILDNFYKNDLGNKIKNTDHFDLDKIKNKKLYDGVLSNFGLQIPLSLDLDKNLNLIYKILDNNSLFCFNLLTINSMKTIRDIFCEIDDYVYKGVFNRFGPFFSIPETIENLNQKKFKDIVVSNEYIELNYQSLNKIRSDFKDFGFINLYSQRPKFKKEFFVKTKSVFSKIIEKFDRIPIEFEIATFTLWK